ncbi:MAG: AAA family ATPase, partial [Lachnospiraceae bacterium]|nr:AAA family ATPase [Lachnospiraceae bacterium]
STLKAYWEGKKELFSGLAIEKLEENNKDAFEPYPVFYFDFNGDNYKKVDIEIVLDGMLSDWEEIYGNQYKGRTVGDRFQKLLELATEKTGKRCVVLIDEYDKPLLDTIEDEELHNHIKDVFKGFFSRLKRADGYIQFLFITGVSKFHKVSIFSDLNQLKDISLTSMYSGICGITEEELKKYFSNEIKELAEEEGMSNDECIVLLRKSYDGYRFHQNGVGVYNPYSLLNVLSDKETDYYWFETGTPTILVNKVKESNFTLKRFTDKSIYANESVLKDYTGDVFDLVPLLYQTGYLTIADYDKRRKRYTLCFPNEEVKYGFLECLMPLFVPKSKAGNGLDIFTLEEYIENGDTDKIYEKKYSTCHCSDMEAAVKAEEFKSSYFANSILDGKE